MTTTAHANIALIKYWGKRGTHLILPTKSSLSITLDGLTTTTTITTSPTSDESASADVITLNHQKLSTQQAGKIVRFLDIFRQKYEMTDHYNIVSHNSFPTAAGLASSASGFAALATALNNFHNLNLSPKELSMLARQGSGSACRSIHGGFVIWHRGNNNDGSDSYAEQLFDRDHWPELRLIVVVLDAKQKSISSRDCMQKTVATSPLYNQWVAQSEKRLPLMIKAIQEKDIRALGELAEEDAFAMHRCIEASTPPVTYWSKQTVEIISLVQALRQNGIACYCTIDAGPNVKIITLQSDVPTIIKQLKRHAAVQQPQRGVPQRGVPLITCRVI